MSLYLQNKVIHLTLTNMSPFDEKKIEEKPQELNIQPSKKKLTE